jgi:predicted ester cyclase
MDDPKAICRRSIELIAEGELEDFQAVTHPDFEYRDAPFAPPECRGQGPAAAYATALWLRSAYADLRWEFHALVREADLVIARCTMSGRHVGDFVEYGADGSPQQVFPPTGRDVAATQMHWFRLADGKVVEHWANRD